MVRPRSGGEQARREDLVDRRLRHTDLAETLESHRRLLVVVRADDREGPLVDGRDGHEGGHRQVVAAGEAVREVGRELGEVVVVLVLGRRPDLPVGQVQVRDQVRERERRHLLGGRLARRHPEAVDEYGPGEGRARKQLVLLEVGEDALPSGPHLSRDRRRDGRQHLIHVALARVHAGEAQDVEEDAGLLSALAVLRDQSLLGDELEEPLENEGHDGGEHHDGALPQLGDAAVELAGPVDGRVGLGLLRRHESILLSIASQLS